MASQSREDKKIKGYRRRFEKFGVDPKALQWVSSKGAELRYREMVADIDFEGRTVLDVGCGFGDIVPFIQKKTKDFKYTGVDIVPEFITAAKEKYPDHTFIERDYYGDPMDGMFDVVLTIGTLNGNIKNAIEFRKKAIKTLFDHAKEVAAFNMAGGHPQPENKDKYKVYYADSEEIVEHCGSLTPDLKVRDQYHSKDFTVVMFR